MFTAYQSYDETINVRTIALIKRPVKLLLLAVFDELFEKLEKPF